MVSLSKAIKRWRENYYVSFALAALGKPLSNVCGFIDDSIQKRIRKNGVVIVLPNGKVLRVAKDSGVYLASCLFWHGLDGYEKDTSKTLCFFFSKASTFVDVGANVGFYSILGSLWNPNLQVISIEPVPSIYRQLNRNISVNGLCERIRSYRLALAANKGQATFYLPTPEGKDFEGTGTLVPDGWQSKEGKSTKITVDAVRFDDFITNNPMRVDLIKIDVEDFEAEVLKGMEQTIRRDRPFIICEVLIRKHRNEETKKMIEALNYRAYAITSIGYVRVSRFDFDRNFENFLLSPIATTDEIVTDLNLLWQLREEQMGV